MTDDDGDHCEGFEGRARAEPTIVALGGDTLREAWDEYRRIFDDRGVPAVTVELVQHGFYVGALSAFLFVIKCGNESDSSEEAAAKIDGLRIELDAFNGEIAQLAGVAPRGSR